MGDIKKSRTFPKCFHLHPNSIFIYNLLNENKLSDSVESKYLFSIYTLLLCGLNGIVSNTFSKEQIFLRIQRSMNIQGEISKEVLLKIVRMLMDKNLLYFQTNLNAQDYQNFLKNHQQLQKKLISELREKF